jgi:hypothetical protein
LSGGLEEEAEAAQASAQQLQQQISEQVLLSHQGSVPCELTVASSLPSSSNSAATECHVLFLAEKMYVFWAP